MPVLAIYLVPALRLLALLRGYMFMMPLEA